MLKHLFTFAGIVLTRKKTFCSMLQQRLMYRTALMDGLMCYTLLLRLNAFRYSKFQYPPQCQFYISQYFV